MTAPPGRPTVGDVLAAAFRGDSPRQRLASARRAWSIVRQYRTEDWWLRCEQLDLLRGQVACLGEVARWQAGENQRLQRTVKMFRREIGRRAN